MCLADPILHKFELLPGISLTEQRITPKAAQRSYGFYPKKHTRRKLAFTPARDRLTPRGNLPLVVLRVSQGCRDGAEDVSRPGRLLKSKIFIAVFLLDLLTRLTLPHRPQLTIATAAVFCHRFYACHSHGEPLNDRFVRTHPSTRVCDVYSASPLFCSTESSSWLADDSNRVSLFSRQGRGNSEASQGGRSSVVPGPAQARV